MGQGKVGWRKRGKGEALSLSPSLPFNHILPSSHSFPSLHLPLLHLSLSSSLSSPLLSSPRSLAMQQPGFASRTPTRTCISPFGSSYHLSTFPTFRTSPSLSLSLSLSLFLSPHSLGSRVTKAAVADLDPSFFCCFKLCSTLPEASKRARSRSTDHKSLDRFVLSFVYVFSPFKVEADLSFASLSLFLSPTSNINKFSQALWLLTLQTRSPAGLK